jgi:tetrapyrrole methylase family protein/MazG family protein
MRKRKFAARDRGIDRLLKVVAKLRGPNGCPWDREQTLSTLKQYLIEESYEVLDAIDSGDVDKHREELGDVLLQVALHSRIRDEQGRFNFDDVADKLADKLIRRHPHVFGNVVARNSKQVLQNWEVIKTAERKDGRKSVVEGIPRHLPALQKAQRIQSRVARLGFDWSRTAEVERKVEEEFREIRQAMRSGKKRRIREEMGDLFFALVNLCRFLDLNAEEVLEKANAKFMKRFMEVERRIHAEGKKVSDCALAEMDAHWEAVKKKEK